MGRQVLHGDKLEAETEPEPYFQRRSLHRKSYRPAGKAIWGDLPPLNQWRKIGGMVLVRQAKVTGKDNRQDYMWSVQRMVNPAE